MKTEIMFQMLILLLNKRKTTREYLSEKFELSLRTVTRYITSLANSGIPIISLHGKDGGITIADDFKISTTYFKEEELQRIKECIDASSKNYFDKTNDIIIDKLSNINYSKTEEKQ